MHTPNPTELDDRLNAVLHRQALVTAISARVARTRHVQPDDVIAALKNWTSTELESYANTLGVDPAQAETPEYRADSDKQVAEAVVRHLAHRAARS